MVGSNLILKCKFKIHLKLTSRSIANSFSVRDLFYVLFEVKNLMVISPTHFLLSQRLLGNCSKYSTQLAITSSNLTIEALEQGVKHVQS